jgi:uncharacterized protein YndB with AHSA1/START domain
MKTIEFNATINASAKAVWTTMLNDKTYRQWVDVSWPGSFYVGKWGKDEEIRFVGNDNSGTLATITEFTPYEVVEAHQIAILLKGGIEDRTSDMAKGWIGTTERYDFSESGGKTTLKVTIKAQPHWLDMFNDGWPQALEKLKELSEK